ncbi:MAG: hypothetical protein QXD03_03980 [Candidatus Anstonellales archaeon]
MEDRLKLYMLIDKKKHGLINYVRECGINISNMYININNLKGRLITDESRCRVVVVDSGSGLFTSPKARKEVIDTIGICDENIRITMFYTDNLLRYDASKELGYKYNYIDWYKYKNFTDVLVKVLDYKEEYVLDSKSSPNDVVNSAMWYLIGEKIEDESNVKLRVNYRYDDRLAMDALKNYLSGKIIEI